MQASYLGTYLLSKLLPMVQLNELQQQLAASHKRYKAYTAQTMDQVASTSQVWVGMAAGPLAGRFTAVHKGSLQSCLRVGKV